ACCSRLTRPLRSTVDGRPRSVTRGVRRRLGTTVVGGKAGLGAEWPRSPSSALRSGGGRGGGRRAATWGRRLRHADAGGAPGRLPGRVRGDRGGALRGVPPLLR